MAPNELNVESAQVIRASTCGGVRYKLLRFDLPNKNKWPSTTDHWIYFTAGQMTVNYKKNIKWDEPDTLGGTRWPRGLNGVPALTLSFVQAHKLQGALREKKNYCSTKKHIPSTLELDVRKQRRTSTRVDRRYRKNNVLNKAINCINEQIYLSINGDKREKALPACVWGRATLFSFIFTREKKRRNSVERCSSWRFILGKSVVWGSIVDYTCTLIAAFQGGTGFTSDSLPFDVVGPLISPLTSSIEAWALSRFYDDDFHS